MANSVNIETLIQAKLGKFKRSKGKHGIEYITRCPFCGRSSKLYVNPVFGKYLCFRCEKTGLVSDLLGKALPAAPRVERPTLQPLSSNIISPGKLCALTSLDDNHPAIRYLNTRKRKFELSELNDTFGVRLCSMGRLFFDLFDTTNTLIFPVVMNRELVGWQSRLLYTPDDMTDDECQTMGFKRDDDGDWIKPPKYCTNPGGTKGRTLFNYDMARQSETVVICEGPFDAMSVGRCAVATLGKGVSDIQARLLMAYWKTVVILLDPGDADVEMEALECQLRHTLSGRVFSVNLRGYKDAGDAPRTELWTQIGEAAHNAGIDLFQHKIVI